MSHGAGGYINGVVSDNKTPSPSQPPVHVKRKPVARKPVGAPTSPGSNTTPTASPQPQTGSPLFGPPIVPYGATVAPGTPPSAKPYRYSSLFDSEPTKPAAAGAPQRRSVSDTRKVAPVSTGAPINFSKPVSPVTQHTQAGFGRAQTAPPEQMTGQTNAPLLPPKVPLTQREQQKQTQNDAHGYQASQFANQSTAGTYSGGGGYTASGGAGGGYGQSGTVNPYSSGQSRTSGSGGSADSAPGGNIPGGSSAARPTSSYGNAPYPVPSPGGSSGYGNKTATHSAGHGYGSAANTASPAASTLPYPAPLSSHTPQTPPTRDVHKFDSPVSKPAAPTAASAESKQPMPPIPKTTMAPTAPVMPPIPKTNVQKVPVHVPAPAPPPAPASPPRPIYQPSHQLPERSPSPGYPSSPPRRTLRVVNDFSSSSDEDEPVQMVPAAARSPAGPRDYPLNQRMSLLEVNDHMDPFTPAAPLRIHKKNPSTASNNASFDFAGRDSFYATPSGSADDISQEYVTNETYLNSQRGERPLSSSSHVFSHGGSDHFDSHMRPMSSHGSSRLSNSHSARPVSNGSGLGGGYEDGAGHTLQPQFTHESTRDPFDPAYDPHDPAYDDDDPPSPPSPAPVLMDPSINIPDPTDYGAFEMGTPLVPSVTSVSTGTATSLPGVRGAPSIISSSTSQKASDYPSLGVESQYVRALRKRTASAWCEVPSKVWGLPLGISDKVGKKFNKNMDMRYAAGLKRTMDIRHSHLKPRLLASEVADDDGKRSSSHVDMPTSMHAPSIHSMSRYDNRSVISHEDDVDGRSSVSLVSAPQEKTPPPTRPRAPSNSSQESVQEVRRIHLFVANPDSD